jgi:alkyl hydroperoxide reductase subunit AhpF
MSNKIAVIGGGSWGTALAISLSGNGHMIKLWDVDKTHLNELSRNRENVRYLPKVKFPDNLQVSFSAEEAINGSDIVLFSVPTQHFRSALEGAIPYLDPKMILVNVAKTIADPLNPAKTIIDPGSVFQYSIPGIDVVGSGTCTVNGKVVSNNLYDLLSEIIDQFESGFDSYDTVDELYGKLDKASMEIIYNITKVGSKTSYLDFMTNRYESQTLESLHSPA